MKLGNENVLAIREAKPRNGAPDRVGLPRDEKLPVWCVSLNDSSQLYDSLILALTELGRAAADGAPGGQYIMTAMEMTRAEFDSHRSPPTGPSPEIRSGTLLPFSKLPSLNS